MSTEELEILLEGATETQSVDFKRATPWEIKSLAKDFLAFANVQGGGMIIVGVREQEGRFIREGVPDDAMRGTYNIDRMRDDLGGFCDPYVNFNVEFPSDANNLPYVVIQIQEFDELPVICVRDSPETFAGRLYYRNRNRRIESAPVSNSNDMRDIIQRAAIKMMRRFDALGLVTRESARERLDAELGTL